MSATITDRLTLLPLLGYLLGQGAFAAVTGLFRDQQLCANYGDHLTRTMVRSMFSTLSVGQLQMLVPSTVSAYEAWCKKTNTSPAVIDVPDTSAKGFWIGDKDTAKYALVYYHGGGFVLPAMPPHFDLFQNFVKWSGGKLAVFVVAYTLAPTAVYPLQIAEGVEALRYVLSQPKFSPETVLIGGDSAGGNLTIAVISHLSGHAHPQADIVKPLKLAAPLKGAIVIAPWVSSDANAFPTMIERGNYDVINIGVALYWMTRYKGPGKTVGDDEYIVPERAAPSWWKGAAVANVIAAAGEIEVLRDAIESWARKFQEGAGDAVAFKLVVGKTEIHDAPLTPLPDAELDKLGDDCQEAAIRNWLKALLV